jgi:hypothetical protein
MKKRLTKPTTVALQGAYACHGYRRAADRPVRAAAGPAVPVPSCAAWAAQALGFAADPVQAAVLNGHHRRLLLLTCRQWGKSVVAAVRALWQALFFPGSLIVVVGPVENQATELNHKIYGFVARLGLAVHGGGHGALRLCFPNGSRIVGLSEVPDHVRGLSAPALILVDEAAFFRGDEILEALMPMLATRPDGAVWLMSTPKGQSGFFYDLWHATAGPWHRVRVTAAEIPGRISAAFLAEQAQRNPEKYRREYCCEFLAADGALFSREALAALLTDEVEPL